MQNESTFRPGTEGAQRKVAAAAAAPAEEEEAEAEAKENRHKQKRNKNLFFCYQYVLHSFNLCLLCLALWHPVFLLVYFIYLPFFKAFCSKPLTRTFALQMAMEC